MSEIRYDPLYDRHVIIAPERLQRPDTFRKVSTSAHRTECPFCIGNESRTPTEIFSIHNRETGGWQTRVVPNLYKALAIEAPHAHHEGTFDHWQGFGAHEVVIDTPRHVTSMALWSIEEARHWLETLQIRFNDLRRDGRIAYISLFKNEGYEAGATMEHPHTQILALPIVPETEAKFFRRSREHYAHAGKTLIASCSEAERFDTRRWIVSNEGFGAYCPYGSGYAFEVMIVCEEGTPFGALEPSQLSTLSAMIIQVMKAMRLQLGEVSYNLSFVTHPLHGEDERAFPAAVRIIPRIYRFGGFEVTAQSMINPVSPETAAERIKESIDV